jgi:uncharacterized membrane protein YedE/YeeE
MFELLNEGQMAALIGGMGGILLGLAARMGRFCTLGAIEDYLYANSQTRLRMWGLSIGVAMFAVFAMMGADLFDPTRTGYLTMYWNPLYSIIGGVMFGYGMALSGNCGYGALARLGGGDLRSFVIVLVAGISAFVVMSGPLAAGARHNLSRQRNHGSGGAKHCVFAGGWTASQRACDWHDNCLHYHHYHVHGR